MNNLNITRWAFTVKWNCPVNDRPHVFEERYDAWINMCHSFQLDITKCCYEKDSSQLLHCHGIVRVPKSFWMRKLNMKGYHTNFEKIYDEAGWLRYCQKDQLPLPTLDQGLLGVALVSDNTLRSLNDQDELDYHTITDLGPRRREAKKTKTNVKTHQDIIKRRLFSIV